MAPDLTSQVGEWLKHGDSNTAHYRNTLGIFEPVSNLTKQVLSPRLPTINHDKHADYLAEGARSITLPPLRFLGSP